MAIVKHLFKDQKATSPFLVFIAGAVSLGAAGAISATYGKGFTIAKTGTGIYTVTLDARGGVPAILGADANVIGASAPALAYITAATPATGVIEISTALASTPGTIANVASGMLSFSVVVQNARYVG